MNTCRSCLRRVLWRKMHPSGKPNPLNPEPDPDRGNVLLVDAPAEAALYGAKVGTALVLKAHQVDEVRAAGQPLYLSHFATCPNRRQHRKAS